MGLTSGSPFLYQATKRETRIRNPEKNGAPGIDSSAMMQ